MRLFNKKIFIKLLATIGVVMGFVVACSVTSFAMSEGQTVRVSKPQVALSYDNGYGNNHALGRLKTAYKHAGTYSNKNQMFYAGNILPYFSADNYLYCIDFSTAVDDRTFATVNKVEVGGGNQ